MAEETIQEGPSPEQKMAGGDWLDVRYLPHERGSAGRVETVFVRMCPLARFADKSFLRALGNEGDLIDFYCSRPAGWNETLTVDSQEEILRLGRQLNFPTFGRWLQSRKDNLHWAGTMISQMEESIRQAIAPLAEIWQSWHAALESSPTSSTGSDSASPKSS